MEISVTLIHKLDVVQRKIVFEVLKTIKEIHEHQDKNGMSLYALSVLFAPALYHLGYNSSLTLLTNKMDKLIERYDYFEVCEVCFIPFLRPRITFYSSRSRSVWIISKEDPRQ